MEHQFKRNQETYTQPGKCLLKWYQMSARRTLLGNSQVMARMTIRRCSLCAPTTRQSVFSMWRRKLWCAGCTKPVDSLGSTDSFLSEPRLPASMLLLKLSGEKAPSRSPLGSLRLKLISLHIDMVFLTLEGNQGDCFIVASITANPQGQGLLLKSYFCGFFFHISSAGFIVQPIC